MVETLDVTYVCSGEFDDFADLDRIFQAVDGPVRNVPNMGWMMQICRLARAGDRRVLLGGDLGNITISWDGWEQAFDHLAGGRIASALRQWRLHYINSTRSPLGSFRRLFLEPSRLATPKIVQWARRPTHSAINPPFARDMRIVERAQQESRNRAAKAGSHALSQRLNAIIGVEFRGEWEAGMLALFGIDLRDPTSDLDVVQFSLGIPDGQYLAEGIDRSVIRRAMWGLLPAPVLTNRRRGDQAADWFGKMSRGRRAMVEENERLRASSLAAEALDLDRLDRLISNWPEAKNTVQGRVAEDYRLALTRGLASGRFLQSFERSNRQIAMNSG